MNLDLNLNDRPFQAIKKGTKKIEGRTPRDINDRRYDELNIGDTLTFKNNVTNEVMICDILFIHKYNDVRSMLESEGVENVLSSGLDVEGGIKSYHSIEDYKERIKKFGIYAIGVKLIK